MVGEEQGNLGFPLFLFYGDLEKSLLYFLVDYYLVIIIIINQVVIWLLVLDFLDTHSAVCRQKKSICFTLNSGPTWLAHGKKCEKYVYVVVGAIYLTVK